MKSRWSFEIEREIGGGRPRTLKQTASVELVLVNYLLWSFYLVTVELLLIKGFVPSALSPCDHILVLWAPSNVPTYQISGDSDGVTFVAQRRNNKERSEGTLRCHQSFVSLDEQLFFVPG